MQKINYTKPTLEEADFGRFATGGSLNQAPNEDNTEAFG